uniref:Uncharacterized protein n=1 Tax=Avena sativa TaxID=4498 RepID=A0ACD5VDZ4_AVESA
MVMATVLKSLTVLLVLAVFAADPVGGRHHHPDCPSFSCGPLGNVSSPFRQASDPPGCGYQSYELVCSDTTATIRIDNATYYVSSINYTSSSFWIVDAELDLYNGCPLPRWNRPPYPYEDNLTFYFDGLGPPSQLDRPPYPYQDDMEVELAPLVRSQALFLKCAQEVNDNGIYMPVACLSINDTFVYVLTGYGSYYMMYLEPSCMYLAMTPLPRENRRLDNSSYAEVVKSMRSGFAVRFPYRNFRERRSIKYCLLYDFRNFHELQVSSEGILILQSVIYNLFVDLSFWSCVLRITGFGHSSPFIAIVIWIVKFIADFFM